MQFDSAKIDNKFNAMKKNIKFLKNEAHTGIEIKKGEE